MKALITFHDKTEITYEGVDHIKDHTSDIIIYSESGVLAILPRDKIKSLITYN